jgi:hypothetical protein
LKPKLLECLSNKEPLDLAAKVLEVRKRPRREIKRGGLFLRERIDLSNLVVR